MFKQLLQKFRNKDTRSKILLGLATKYVNPWLRKMDMTLIVHHFYQPIPSVDEVKLYYNRRRPVEVLDLNIEGQTTFTDSLLACYSNEFNDPRILNAFGYSESDGSFGCGSREFYYSMLRNYKPRRVIEIGAGNSSLICLAALRMNYMETKDKADFITIDPFPDKLVRHAAQAKYDFVNFTLIESRLQEVAPTIFKTLSANDILFVDSSHVFKQGSDVEYEFLKVYPYLAKGVFVHIHDIFTPYDYPAVWNNRHFRFWNEQYFLENFLMCNHDFQVIAGLYMLSREQRDVFTSHISSFSKDQSSGSFWIQVTGREKG